MIQVYKELLHLARLRINFLPFRQLASFLQKKRSSHLDFLLTNLNLCGAFKDTCPQSLLPFLSVLLNKYSESHSAKPLNCTNHKCIRVPVLFL